jgi:hypothetical protein
VAGDAVTLLLPCEAPLHRQLQLLTVLHCWVFGRTLLERAPGMSMAAYSSGYSPMKFHTEVNTSFTTNGSSFFSLQPNTRNKRE